jgi:hypothetical protein
VCGQPAELEQFMLFEFSRQRHSIEVVKAVNRVAESFVVFFVDQQLIVCVVDRFNVELFKSGE